MAQISNAGINNYVSQQAAQHTVQQAAKAASSDEARRTKETGKPTASLRGVIVQISKEGRDLAKAARVQDNTQSALNSERSRNDLQNAIVNAKQRQRELQDDVHQSDAILPEQENREFMVNDVIAA